MTRDLGALFAPRSVAVVGASSKAGSVGGSVFWNLVRGGFAGPVYPVNRQAHAVRSVRAYARLEDLPEVPDLVVVAVPAEQVLAVARSAVSVGARALCVISAGFSEVGPQGKALEQALVRLVRQAQMPMLGPNCLGLQNANPLVRLDATFATTFAGDGPVAFASQSGALGLAALDYAASMGIGFCTFASLGNKADLSGNDLLEYFEQDARAKVVLLYLESVGNPARFREIAARVGRSKPIVLVKSGRSGAGARAAQSHTGALVGSDAALTALCEQAGIIRTDTLEEMFDVASVLATQPLPGSGRVGVITNAGGPGILAADALEAAGLQVPRVNANTEETLRALLPPHAAVQNPVDVLADTAPEAYGRALEGLLADPEIDAVLALYVPPAIGSADATATAISRAAQTTGKPVIACVMGTRGVPSALDTLRQARIPTFRFPEGAARALGRVAGYSHWRDTPAASSLALPPLPDAVTQVLAGVRRRLGPAGGWFSTPEALALADACGIAVPPYRRVGPTAEAVAHAWRELGGPVVVKAEVPGVIHKTEVGAVSGRLDSREAIAAAVAGMGALGPEGYVVQCYVDKGEEWLVGAVRPKGQEPLLTVGAGGTRAELWRDVCSRLAPLSSQDVRTLVERPRIGKTLHGWRGAPPIDPAPLMNAIARVAACMQADSAIDEFELNPLRVPAGRSGALALDVRVHLRHAVG